MRRLALAVAIMLAAALASAQPAQLYVVTYVDVYPNFAADAVKLLTEFRDASLKDKGAVRFEVLRDVGRPNHMAIVEVWSSRQAYEAHRMQPYTRQFREKLQPMLGSPFDERLYNSLP